jgi:hypothetical protein
MRTIILAVCALAVGCDQAGRVRDLERQVEKQERIIRAQHEEITALRTKLNEAQTVGSESRRAAVNSKNQLLIARAKGAPVPPPPVPAQSAPINVTAPPEEPPAPKPPQGPRVIILGASTSPADVARASDFSQAPAAIDRHCTLEAGADRLAFDDCAARQRAAVATLSHNRPFGSDDHAWSDARIRCAHDSPEDFVERLRCEQRLVH